MKFGYTYLFFNPADGLTKIGRSNSPLKRLVRLSEGCKSKLVPLCIFDDDRECELHMEYEKFRVHGEWFQLPDYVRESFGMIEPSELPTNNRANISISLPRETLRKIDSMAEACGRTRSNFIHYWFEKSIRETTTTNTSEQ